MNETSFIEKETQKGWRKKLLSCRSALNEDKEKLSYETEDFNNIEFLVLESIRSEEKFQGRQLQSWTLVQPWKSLIMVC